MVAFLILHVQKANQAAGAAEAGADGAALTARRPLLTTAPLTTARAP